MAGIAEDPVSNKGAPYVVHDVEDQPPHSDAGEITPDDGLIVTQHERLGLMRGLSQRHVQMIAIAGAIVGGDLKF
jgi:amino acid transporter